MGQTQPPVVEQNRCNCTALRKASRRVSQFYDSALAPSGLRSTQFAILADLNRRGDVAPTIRELSEAMVIDQSTIGQNLRPLERQGLVALARDETDRRYRRVTITRAGYARFAAAHPLWRDAQKRFEDSFGKRDATDLRGVLLSIANNEALVIDGEGLTDEQD